jgi:hypothetical protein
VSEVQALDIDEAGIAQSLINMRLDSQQLEQQYLLEVEDCEAVQTVADAPPFTPGQLVAVNNINISVDSHTPESPNAKLLMDRVVSSEPGQFVSYSTRLGTQGFSSERCQVCGGLGHEAAYCSLCAKGTRGLISLPELAKVEDDQRWMNCILRAGEFGKLAEEHGKLGSTEAVSREEALECFIARSRAFRDVYLSRPQPKTGYGNGGGGGFNGGGNGGSGFRGQSGGRGGGRGMKDNYYPNSRNHHQGGGHGGNSQHRGNHHQAVSQVMSVFRLYVGQC